MPGGDRHSRGARVAVPPGLGPVRAVSRQRARLRRGRAQRARLIRLRQELPRPRQRRAARGRGARHRLAAGVDRRAAAARSRAGRGDGRLVRRLPGARLPHRLWRAAARGDRPRRDQQLRDLPAQHCRLPARSAARRIRRRARHQHAGVPQSHLAPDQREAHQEAAAGGGGGQRPARAGVRVRAAGVERARRRR